VKLGVAKSTAYAWVKHIPLDPDSDLVRGREFETLAPTRPADVHQQ
jgi:hypothetical protein